MPDSLPQTKTLTNTFNRSALSPLYWVLMPAIIMSLGWGLRGYIGGGPLGAMIAGVFVSLLLCQYLGLAARAAAVVVAFGTLGIAFGGEMTYGQTLGLLREPDTFWWGLLGTTLKGGVWGLLGGAMLGLGFVARQMPWRHLILALACLLLGVILGLHFINQPRLIYFSDPVNSPRDESWAGFLLGTVALLGYLSIFQRQLAGIPIRFAIHGGVGGAIGFGGGSLLLALRFHVAESWRWLPYWKFMEFAFGFVFGAALGHCVWLLRDRLAPSQEERSTTDAPREPAAVKPNWGKPLLLAVILVVFLGYGWDWLLQQTAPLLGNASPDAFAQSVARVILGFMGLGCLLALVSRMSQTVAWQTSVTFTILAAMIDWQRDLLPRGDIDLPAAARHLIVLSVAAVSLAYVWWWQRRRQPNLMDLLIFALCVLMGIGYLTGLSRAEIWSPDPASYGPESGDKANFRNHYASELLVHIIFTALFVASLLAAVKARRRTL